MSFDSNGRWNRPRRYRSKGRVSHAQRYAITATQFELDYQAKIRQSPFPRPPYMTGPRAGMLRVEMSYDHWCDHHSGTQTTSPLPGTRASRRPWCLKG